MFGLITKRCFHVSQSSMAITKSSGLAKLRKSTGYSVSSCKKALEMFPDDIKKAEEWLHGEAKSKGWSKWAKVQSRTTTQGLIGVCSQDNVGVMVEVNCETDFVSKNSEFQEYVAKMISGCMNFASKLHVESDVTKEVLEEAQLNAVKCESSTLGELLVAATCKFNEKTVAKRAVFFKVKDEVLLSCLSHPAAACPSLNKASIGKYGVLLATKKTKDVENIDTISVGLNMCQHIIGMNPSSVGQLTEKDIAKFSSQEKSETDLPSSTDETIKVEQTTDVEITEESDDADEQQETVHSALKDSDETRLMFQPFLLEPDTSVGETLYKSGIDIVAFERFECGEHTEEPAIAQSATG